MLSLVKLISSDSHLSVLDFHCEVDQARKSWRRAAKFSMLWTGHKRPERLPWSAPLGRFRLSPVPFWLGSTQENLPSEWLRTTSQMWSFGWVLLVQEEATPRLAEMAGVIAPIDYLILWIFFCWPWKGRWILYSLLLFLKIITIIFISLTFPEDMWKCYVTFCLERFNRKTNNKELRQKVIFF